MRFWAVRMSNTWNKSSTEGAGTIEMYGNKLSQMVIYYIYIN